MFEPQDPGSYLGKHTLKELCAEYEVGVADVIALLKQHGIEAKPNSAFETIAKEAGLSPSELFALVTSNL